MQKDSKLIASSFTNLKAKVKAEMLRRNAVGSVANYGGVAYDYSTVPTTDGKIQTEHISKLQDPLNAVNSSTNPIKDIVFVKELETADAHVTYLTSAPATALAANTGCMASCTGLCSSGCSSSCTSCSGSCSGGCSGCSGGCSGCSGCGGACSSSCSGGCDGSCLVSCTGSCDGCTGCGGSCSSSCSGTCSSGCTGSSSGSCSGCSVGCSAM